MGDVQDTLLFSAAAAANATAPALLGGLWRACFQGALLFAAVWLVCKALPRLPARVRAALWWACCAKLVLGLALCVVSLPVPILPTHASGEPVGFRLLRRFAPPARIVAAPTAVYRVPTRSEGDAPAVTVPAARAERAPVAAPSAAAPASAPATVWLSTRARVAGLYLFGALLLALASLRASLAARRLLRDAVVTDLFDEEAGPVARALGLRRVPRVALSERVPAPLVAGLLRPVVVLPAAFEELPEAERRMALAHEMAHLRRGDLWAALVPAAARALFFFFPPAHWAAREWAACREEACDLAAVEATGAPAAGYGRLLLAMVAQQRASAGRPRGGFAVLGMAAPGFALMRRRLATLQQDAGRPVGRAVRALALGLVGLSAVSLLPWRLAALGRPAAAAPAPQDDPLPVYELTDLGTLGGKYSDALAINDAGDVVGAANVYPQGGMGHAFLSRGGRMADLAAGSIYRHSTAHDVNGSGKVAASAYRSSYRKTAQLAFLWDGKQRVFLGTLPGFAFARAVGINDRDQVVGNALTGRSDAVGAVESRAFLWQERRMREMGTLGGPHSHATAINDAGQVVGKADLPAPDGEKPATHAFLYDDGSMRDLGALPGGRNSVALGVNGRGVVVGYSEAGEPAADGPRAFAWEDGAMRDLGAPAGFGSAAALGVNDAGVAVGQASRDDRPEPRAVAWLPGGDGRRRAVDLNDRLTANPGGWVLETARAVNARGQIVGRGIIGGQRRAFLLTPVAPPQKR